MRSFTAGRVLAAAAVAAVAATVPAAGPATAGADGEFGAIVELSSCSGAVVQLPDATASDQALVLTNGHCLPTLPEPGEVVSNRASERTFTLLDPAGEELGELTADRLVYATMTDTDAAVYRLRETYADLRADYDTDALPLAETRPKAGTEIDVVSGYWRRVYSCAIDGFVPELREDGYTSRDAIRYTAGCDTVGGSSGSPIVGPEGEVVGVNNTAYEDSGDDCSLDNPCEVDRGGRVTVVQDAHYGQQTYHLAGCISTRGVATPHRSSCQLPSA
ncbi:MAG: serine protease [Streptosporangiales bacterium]|nr:serine protease [Streptosporangiales bacterium]